MFESSKENPATDCNNPHSSPDFREQGEANHDLGQITQAEDVPMEALREAALARGPAVTHEDKLVNHFEGGCEASCFMVSQSIHEENGNFIFDSQVYPKLPDYLRVCLSKPYVARKTLPISRETASEWMRRNIALPRKSIVDCRGGDYETTRTIFASPERDFAGKKFITGREFNYPGDIRTRECLYFHLADKQMLLEVTVFDKAPVDLGLQGDKPYLLRAVMPLSETAADFWVRQTGAPDDDPVMFVRTFRQLYTGISPYDGFNLAAWRRPY